jgi:hypothetical protein
LVRHETVGTRLINAGHEMPVPHGKNGQGFVTVTVGIGRRKARLDGDGIQMADTPQGVYHELAFGLELFGVMEMLPLAASTFLEDGAKGGDPVGRTLKEF